MLKDLRDEEPPILNITEKSGFWYIILQSAINQMLTSKFNSTFKAFFVGKRKQQTGKSGSHDILMPKL